jgi:hypothetical protein
MKLKKAVELRAKLLKRLHLPREKRKTIYANLDVPRAMSNHGGEAISTGQINPRTSNDLASHLHA